MENEIKELKRLARATGALVFALFSVFPMFVLGWLASAIARHPEAEKSIAAEPVYEFLVWWQGGLKTFPLIFILMFYLLIFFALSYAFVKHGYSHPVDGLKKSSVVLRKFLIPAYLSFAAFGGGIFGGDSISAMNNSFIVVGVLSAFAGFIFYVIDIDEIE
jgi:hypothetical protein